MCNFQGLRVNDVGLRVLLCLMLAHEYFVYSAIAGMIILQGSQVAKRPPLSGVRLAID